MSKFAILFLLVLTYGSYLALVSGPAWGFYLYELVYFLNPKTRWWSSGLPELRYPLMVSLLMLVSYFFRRAKLVNNRFSDIPQAKWILATFIVYCLVYFVAISPELHLIATINLFKLVIIIFIAYRALETYDLLDFAVLTYLIGAMYIGYEAYNIGRNEFGRIEMIGTVDSPGANGTASILAPAIPLLIYFVWRGHWKYKILVALSGVFIVNGLILINSRGAFIAAGIGFIYFTGSILLSKYKLPKQRIVAFLIILISFLAAYELADETFWERMQTISESKGDTSTSGDTRTIFWMASLDMLKDHPFGLGAYGYQLKSFSYLDEEQVQRALSEGHQGRAVHSIWFQGLSEIGWLGFLFFLLIFISTLRHNQRAKKALIRRSQYSRYYFILSLEGSLLAFLGAATFIDQFRSELLYWLIMFNFTASVIALRDLQEDMTDHEM
jgi:O-antigen ligase